MPDIYLDKSHSDLTDIDKIKSAILQSVNESTTVTLDRDLLKSTEFGGLQGEWRSWLNRFTTDHELIAVDVQNTIILAKQDRIAPDDVV